MRRKLGRQTDRSLHERVVGFVGAVGRVGVRQVGDAQEQSRSALDDIELVGQDPLVIAERAAAQLQLLGSMGVTVATKLTNSLRQVVDLVPDCISLGDDVARQPSNAIARSSWAITSDWPRLDSAA